ncbi:MAG TPA: CvpA family protein [Stellaceae bacterium]|nr:CvpA family protein [Stellaceae bacterium]
MNLVDLAVLAVIALSAIFAFARGFVREALSIAAWGGAALITLYGFDYVYGITTRFVTTPLLADLIAGAGLFLVALIGLTIVTGYVARLAQWSALSPIDRTLGLIFGVARGVVLVSVAYFLVDITLPPNDRPAWLRDARSQPLLAQGADALRGILPESLQLRSASMADDAQRALGQAKSARDAMGALSSPVVPIPPKSQDAPAPNYKPADQRELNRLIDNAH